MSFHHSIISALFLCMLLSYAQAQPLFKFKGCTDLKDYYVKNALTRLRQFGYSPPSPCSSRRGRFSGIHIGCIGGRGGSGRRGRGARGGRGGDGIIEGDFGVGGDGGNGGRGGRGVSTTPSIPQEGGVDFSETNNQVDGVDEPDVIKTDGNRVFVMRGSTFYVVKVTSEGKAGTRSASLKLPTSASNMLLHRDRILVISSSQGKLSASSNSKKGRRQSSQPCRPTGPLTIVYQISVSGSTPKILSTLRMEGKYISGREVSGIARIITSFNPSENIPSSCSGVSRYSSNENAYKKAIRETTFRDWLPQYEVDGCGGKPSGLGLSSCSSKIRGSLVSCSNVYRPESVFTGFKQVSIVTIPLSGNPIPRDGISVLSDAEEVYSTASSLYVTATEPRYDLNDDVSRIGADFKTFVHKFSLTQSSATYVASGAVGGSLLNQFSMHEFKGRFFIATTVGASWWARQDASKSSVTALEVKARRLLQIGKVGNLGVGERIFAVRYVQDTAYVVTFREVDPLYIVDLSDPSNLRVTGELKIPGFSSYLHPVGPGRILGVGTEVTRGRQIGAKVTLFDVSNVTKPKELSSWVLRGSSSPAQFDHRAFLFWAPESIAVLPVSVGFRSGQFRGSIVLNVGDKEITERGRIEHSKCCGQFSTPKVERNLVLFQTNLWSLSSNQLQINNIKSLAVEGTVKLDD